jgi:hypothetical protein
MVWLLLLKMLFQFWVFLQYLLKAVLDSISLGHTESNNSEGSIRLVRKILNGQVDYYFSLSWIVTPPTSVINTVLYVTKLDAQ